MRIEELTPAEFEQLKAVHDGFCPDPNSSVAIVAKQDDQIVGRIFLLSPTHLEGPWIDPQHRRGVLFEWLVRAAEDRAKQAGITKVFAYGANEEMNSYIKRLGYRQAPLTVWEKEL